MQNMQPIPSAGMVHDSSRDNKNATPSSLPNGRIPIRVVLPEHRNLSERRIIVHVSSSVQKIQLQSILTGPVIDAAVGLPAHEATSLIQQHINQRFEGPPLITPLRFLNPVQVVRQSTTNFIQPQMQGQSQDNLARQLDGAYGEALDETHEAKHL